MSSLSGCVTAFDRNRSTLEAMHEQGAYDAAARMLDDPAQKDLYSDKNRLLYWLDRGAIALAQNDLNKAIELLEQAEASMEQHREPSGGEELTRWLLNDTAVSYSGEPYEEIYVNVLKLLAQLEAGRIEGGATVEARRASGKADVLRDRYIRARDSVINTGDADYKSRLNATIGRVDANDAGEFIESTLGTYLSAITFLKSGEFSFQSVAARRLQTAIDLQRTLQGGDTINNAAFTGLGDLRASDVNVVVVGLSGRGPVKVPRRIGPIPLYEWPVYFELPELAGGSQEVGAVRVVFEPVAGGQPITHTLSKIEDMGTVAAENQRRQLPLIYARTLLRSQLKAAAAFAATQAAKNSSRRGSDRDIAQAVLVIAGLMFVAGTEKADLRCWTFLPGRADVGHFRLPPGIYRVRTQYLSRSGGVGVGVGGRGGVGGVVYESPPKEITAGASPTDLTTIVEHYWR